MLEGNVYAITGMVSALMCYAIFLCNNTLYDKDNVIRSYFSVLLNVFIICNMLDAIWGFMSTGTIDWGRTVFCIVSFLLQL